ncbi:MAG: cytochrome B [Gammaproteobacteria bacterium]|nr:MAG: cytochrome B [Gammaproteobacteria bacterium]
MNSSNENLLIRVDKKYVWDPLVRIFHWTLVVAFSVAFISEDDYLTIHSWAGYTILSLLTIRIFWGFVGTKYAKFSNFVFPKQDITQFIKDTFSLKAKRYLGHNPAGGAMVIILIFSLLFTAGSGLVIFAIEEGQGPLVFLLSDISPYWGDIIEEVHEFFANFVLFLIAVHITGVIIESLIHRENLIKSMFTGLKRRQ